MLDFITVLEAALPRLFKGATEHYLNSNKSHLRQTSSKLQPSQETIERIQQSNIWKMENELYEFALEHFKFVKKRLLIKEPNGVAQIFFYEKIRPKWDYVFFATVFASISRNVRTFLTLNAFLVEIISPLFYIK